MSNNCKVFSTRFPFHPLVEIGVCSRQKLTHTPICSLWDHGLPEESSIWHSYCILNSPPTFHQLLKDSSLYARQKGQINTQQDFIKTNQNFPQKRIFDSLPLLISFLCSQVPKRQMSVLVTSVLPLRVAIHKHIQDTDESEWAPTALDQQVFPG